MFEGLVYYIRTILPRVRSVSVTKSGKLIRCDTADGPVYAVNSSANRKELSRHGWGL